MFTTYSTLALKRTFFGVEKSRHDVFCHPVPAKGCKSDLSTPVDERSKTSVYGRSLGGVAGSNLAGVMDICVMCVVS